LDGGYPLCIFTFSYLCDKLSVMAFDLKKELEGYYDFLSDALAIAKERWLKIGVENVNVSTLIWQCQNRIKTFKKNSDTRCFDVQERFKTEMEVMDDALKESNTILEEIGKIPTKLDRTA
jgi:hypothetical protein